MNAWAILQTHLSAPEIAGAVVIGLLALWLILALFRRRPAPPPGQNGFVGIPSTSGPLDAAINAAERAIVALARTKVASAGAFHFGAVDISPVHLAYWITSATDAERDRLEADAALRDAFRSALAQAGYPADAIPKVGFAFQSQETVDREYGGNWWYAVK